MVLLFDATVAVAGGVAVAGVVVLEDVLLVEAVAAPCVVVVELLEDVDACVRSIVPTFGGARLATESEALGTAEALLEPSPPPQAARASVVSVHRTALRATSVRFFIDHYPG
jgi:hypothetical protein